MHKTSECDICQTNLHIWGTSIFNGETGEHYPVKDVVIKTAEIDPELICTTCLHTYKLHDAYGRMCKGITNNNQCLCEHFSRNIVPGRFLKE